MQPKQPMFYRAPMPAPLAPTKNPPNGSRVRLPTDVVGGQLGYVAGQAVPLIMAKNLDWGPWAITLDPVAQDPAVYDGAPVALAGAPFSGSPWAGNPRARLSWGVAGIIRTVEFDYPQLGGCVVVNANSVEMSVHATIANRNLFTATEAANVGAWITPSARPAGETQAQLGNPDNTSQTSVPPFAKYLVVSPYVAAGAVVTASEMQVSFMDKSLTRLWHYRKLVGAGTSGDMQERIRVPPWAVVVEIAFNPAGAIRNTSLWELAFS